MPPVVRMDLLMVGVFFCLSLVVCMFVTLQTERLALRDFTSSRQPPKWAPAGGRAVTMTGKSPEPVGINSHGLRGRWCPTICPKIAYANGVALVPAGTKTKKTW